MSTLKNTAITTAVAAGTAGAVLASAGAASAVSSTFITSQPHSVQRACAERILAAQGPGAWTAWSGSLEDMFAESGNSDTAINPSSGAAGYYQIMPSTWDDLCSDIGTSVGSSVTAVPVAPEPDPAPSSTYVAPEPDNTWSSDYWGHDDWSSDDDEASVSSSGGGSYTVQAGDTLSGIGASLGVDWNTLYQNNVGVVGDNPNLIYPGQVLSY